MKFKFKSLPELLTYFADEQKCLDYLAEQRWGSKPVCVKCGSTGTQWKIEGGKRYRCSDCKDKYSVTVGTVFENCKIRKSHVFAAIYLAANSKKGISSVQLGKHLGITQKSAWLLLHKVREMFRDKSPELLGGSVEADETYVGGKISNMHLSKREEIKNKMSPLIKTAVLGILERNGRVITYVMPNVDSATVIPLLAKNVAADAVMITDASKIYIPVSKTHTHHIINHNQGEYVRDGFIHTNSIENFWSILKRGIIGVYHYVSPKHLHRYCDEFSFRYNTRSASDLQRFYGSLTVVDGKLTYKQLTKNAS